MMPVPAPPLPFPSGFFQSGMEDVCGAGEICSRSDRQLEGLGENHGLGFDLSPLSAVFGAGAGIFGAITQKHIADKQASLEAAALKAQKEQNAREFALAKVQIAQLPSQQKRTTTLIALYAIGGVAALISGIFLVAAIRGKKKAD